MFKLIDKIPMSVLVVLSIFLTIAPMHPEPHLVEKLRMLSEGTLSRPIDIFDLFLHGTPITLLIIRLLRFKKAG